MECRGIRGATTVENNNREELISAARELLKQIVRANSLAVDDIVCAFFTTTPDLTADFPAVAARELGWSHIPLMCAHEMNVPGSLPRCLRVLLLVNTNKGPREMVHVYLKEAKKLRPDLG